MASDMDLDQRPHVSLPARLDGESVPDARILLFAAIDRAPGDVVVDMSSVEWVGVAGLGLLAAAHERSRRRGHHLVLLDPSPGLRRMLAVTRLHRVLRIAG